VKIVRELLGVVASERADAGMVVASGTFTPDAIEFASRNPITLIDGVELEQMISRLQKQTTKTPVIQPSPSLPTCPRCGASMVRRVARRGIHANREFLGCSGYPGCRGTRQLA
jgi:restriction system protein